MNARTVKAVRPLTQEGTVQATMGTPQADSELSQIGAFVQDTITWDLNGHDFSVRPGVRWAYQYAQPKNQSGLMSNNGRITDTSDLYGTMIDSKVLPALTFQYALTPDLGVYLQYKRGVQFPTANQLYGAWSLGYGGSGSTYAILSSPELKTETSNNYELGLKGELVEGVTIGASTFYSDYQNFIGITRYSCTTTTKCSGYPSSISTVYQYENRDKAYIYGGELTARFKLGTWFQQAEGFSTRLAFGYAEGAAKSSYDGDKYVDLESVPPMKAVVGVAYDAPDQLYGAALTATFNKGKRATATSRAGYQNSGTAITDSTTTYMNVPGYGVVDLSAYYRVNSNVKITGGIYNLTDRKYWDYLSTRNIEEATSTSSSDKNYYDQQLSIAPGRSFQLGVNVDF